MSFDPLKWPHRFLDMATLAASWSKDPSTKVGAVIADSFNRIISIGYNGFAHSFPDEAEMLSSREKKLALTIHAEENALLFARQSVVGCTIYVTHQPCSLCMSKLAQVGIRLVYTFHPEHEFAVRWKDSMELSRRVAEMSGIRLVEIAR